MKYIKENISKYATSTGFIGSNIEKVMRLLDVLNFLFSKSSFKNKLILKGGTAINLIHTNLKRLSVDIDLDYCGSLDKNIALKDRELLEKELDDFMIREEYEVSTKSRSSFALFSRIYRYENAFGNIDTIKVDINFMDRVHLYSYAISTVTYFDKTVTVKTPAIEELFGMKTNALIDRSKPRDLYDSVFLVDNMRLFDKNMLRKAIIFYLSLNNIFKIDKTSLDRINTINNKNIKVELLPVLKKNERIDLEETKEKVINSLSKLLVLSDSEKQYLDSFSKGNYNPSLLFDEPVASRAMNHPMAKWRIMNLKK